MSRNAVVNRDKCGRCQAVHGGNDHLCPVHGAVSRGCCEPACDRTDWLALYYKNENGQVYRTRMANKRETDLSGWVRDGQAFGLPKYEKENLKCQDLKKSIRWARHSKQS